jgi:hypothetical protein
MFSLEINGAFRGHFTTSDEAMAAVDRWARPYQASWVIYDRYGKVYSQG